MRIVYLPSARDDLLWLRQYYTTIFPDGAARALHHLQRAEETLIRHPAIGRKTDVPNARELVIPRTPFSLLCQITEDEIRILRVWDNRAGGKSGS